MLLIHCTCLKKICIYIKYISETSVDCQLPAEDRVNRVFIITLHNARNSNNKTNICRDFLKKKNGSNFSKKKIVYSLNWKVESNSLPCLSYQTLPILNLGLNLLQTLGNLD